MFPFFLGYRDAEGFVTLSVSFDTDPCLSVMVVTRWTSATIVTIITFLPFVSTNSTTRDCLSQHKGPGVFGSSQRFRELKLPKNYRLATAPHTVRSCRQPRSFAIGSCFSLKQLVRQLEEECETLLAQSQTAEMHSPSSIWVS